MPRLQAEIEDPRNGDKYMVDETVSPMEIKRNFMQYKDCLRRFHVSAEEFFSLLRFRNSSLENVEEDEKVQEQEDEAWNREQRGGIEYLAKLPTELKILILQFSGPKGFFKML